jgi:tripartite-type tricarboxylate transporter receptor subunit TctC
VPSATPENVVSHLNSELSKALQNLETRNSFEKVGAEPVGNTRRDAAVFIKAESKKWAEVVRNAKIKTD